MPEVIFISGIHGTGKSTLGQNISDKLGIPFASASETIKKVIVNKNWDKQKRVSNSNANQDALIQGIDLHYSRFSTLILDGHFTLIDKEGNISFIHESVFSKLNISMIIVCKLEVQLIYERLLQRDQVTYSKKFLETFQEAELFQAEKIANSLDIPLLYFDTGNDTEDDIVSKLQLIGGSHNEN